MRKTKKMSKKGNQCDICNKCIVGSLYKFKSHLYQHNAVQPRFKCPYCSREFFRSDTFSRHVNRHTGAVTQKAYICDHCDRSFVVKRNLIRHLKIHDDYGINGFFQFKCMACGVYYCEERLLKYHIRKTHFNLKDRESAHLKKRLNDTWVERVKESEVVVQMTKLNNNVLSIKKCGTVKRRMDKKPEKTDKENQEDKKLKSADEKAKFKEYITSVFAHKDKSQYSKATCDYCKKEMLKKSLLSHIRERHLKLRRFKCDECKCTFKRHYQMVDHICGKFKPKRRSK